MLKRYAHLFITFAACFAGSAASLFAQNASISGSNFICPGMCYEYTFVVPGGVSLTDVVWTAPGFDIQSTSGNLALICNFSGTAGVFVITATGTNSNGGMVTASMDVISDSVTILQIIGPTAVCSGEIVTYYSDNGFVTNSPWQVSGNASLISCCSNPTVVVQVGNSGSFTLSITSFGQIGCPITSSLDVTVIGTPQILTVGAACPSDSLTTCEKVCANTSATYEVAGVPPTTPVDWTVLGAEDYEVSGSSVTVQWGAPGQGEVSASVGGGGQGGAPMQIYCGQQQIDPQMPAGSTGTGYLQIFHGEAPFDIVLTSVSGGTASLISNTDFYLINLLQAGTYSMQVTDASGETDVCTFSIVITDAQCWVSAYPAEVDPPTSPNGCNGLLFPNAVGGSPPYSYQWSDGSTTAIIQGACCGTYSLTVTDSQGCTADMTYTFSCDSTSSCSGSSSLCVNILEEAQAAIASLPIAIGTATNGTIVICQGQSVFFENESTGATSYVWDFGDFQTSASFEPEHVYNTPGMYLVSLIARNECFCSDTTFTEIYVLPAITPDIQCVGTICEGETVTYSTSANCGTYDWTLTGSYNILDGGGAGDNFITVEWTAGPEGTVSLGVIGCAGSVCTTPNVIPIAILSDNVQIQGKDKVCQNSTEEYFIPNYQGTEIIWTVLGAGFIESGWGTNRISVNWFGAANQGNPQRVIVEFNNCYLECSGRDTLLVNIVPNFYTTGPIEICQNSSGSFQSRNAINDALMPSNWEVFNSAGTSVWTSAAATNTANIPFTFPVGKYIVRAMPALASGFCNERYDIFTEIIALPPPPASIAGATEICPGTAYSYTANGNPLNDFVWNITGGTPATASGNPVNVVWGAAPPYSISAMQISTTGAACASPPVILTVNPLPNFSITGDDEVCREATGTYTAPTFENLDYQWAVLPANAGSVLSGQGTTSVDVQWHAAGNHMVGVSACGIAHTFNVTVNPLPEPFVPDGEVCLGATTAVATTASFTTYAWRNEGGATVSGAASPSLGGGFYEVEVTDANGCTGDANFEIVELPSPNVSISTPAYYALCAGGPPVTLHATEGDPAFSYAWTRNGTPVGGNSPTHSTTQPGDYQVVATNTYGCTASANLELVDCASIGGTCVGGLCVGGGGLPSPGCPANGTIDFNSATTADCAVLSFTNTSTNFVPGSFTWFFGDGGTSNQFSPSHTFPGAGFYTVILVGSVNATVPPGGSCSVYTFKDVLIPVEADFDASVACPGEPVQFNDLSVFISPASVSGWQWDFGNPASGAANASTLQNPTHTFAAQGNYTVSLIITSTGGCVTVVIKNITVNAPPDVIFAPPAQSCEQTALQFEAIPLSDFTSVEWDFGDPGSGAGNASLLVNTFHEFDAAGAYPVTLTATNVFGCTATFTDNLGVTTNPLTGVITMVPPSPICEGDASTLTAPGGGTSYVWSTGDLTTSITASQSDVFSVTLTDDEGCTYSPPPATLDVTPEPNGIIKAVEYNEFGQPVAFFENNYTVCEGDDVTLLIQGSHNYGYSWSNSDSGDEISFTEDKGNLLPVGNHNFSVTVTDNLSGCTSVEGPFLVTVNPAPDVTIASVPTGYLCENNAAALNVVSPLGGINYAWNTGELGTSISVIAGGIYFARAINSFGCEGRSNEIEIHNAPDIDLIPAGCHTRCQPDTMCLPPQAVGTSFQWFLDGSPVASPNGTLQNPIFNQSGIYTVAVTDAFGCVSMSGSLTLDLFTGFGELNGTVWFDVNGNGIIDAPDTTVSGVNIFLTNAGMNLDTVTSNAAGDYFFTNILATNYLAVVDTAALPPGWSAVQVNASVSLVGCDDEESADWLLTNNCIPTSAAVTLDACEGESADYEGTPVLAGDTEIFTLVNANGCDSMVTVTVNALPVSAETLTLFACSGDVAIYAGQPLAPGEELVVPGTNWLGCDSVLTVTVEGLPNTVLIVDAVACEGTFFDYNGVPVPAGTEQVFTAVNADGCLDSVIVAVASIAADASALLLTACPGAFVTYDGQQLFPGDVEVFPLQNQFGCDSLVTVTVTEGSEDFSGVDLLACPGGSAEYLGTALSPGTDTMFVLTNQQGCDSLVHVVVSGSPPVSYDLTATEICFNGTDGIITVGNVSGSTAPFEVSLDGTNFQPGLVFEGLPGGDYTVILQDENDCRFEESISIPVVPQMQIQAGDETLVCGDSVRLAPTVVSQLPFTWEWQDGSTDSVFWAKTPGVFTFKVVSACETVERNIAIALEDSLARSPIYLPNAFSPNDDGINDCFRGYISSDLQLLDYQLLVFDRWGNQMFETKDIEGCWDGKFRGEGMDPAVFVWYVRMRVVDCDGAEKEIFREGGVTVVR